MDWVEPDFGLNRSAHNIRDRTATQHRMNEQKHAAKRLWGELIEWAMSMIVIYEYKRETGEHICTIYFRDMNRLQMSQQACRIADENKKYKCSTIQRNEDKGWLRNARLNQQRRAEYD